MGRNQPRDFRSKSRGAPDHPPADVAGVGQLRPAAVDGSADTPGYPAAVNTLAGWPATSGEVGPLAVVRTVGPVRTANQPVPNSIAIGERPSLTNGYAVHAPPRPNPTAD